VGAKKLKDAFSATAILVALVAAPFADAGGLRIRLSVTNRGPMPRDRELASGGVPLPMGAEHDPAGFRVVDSAGLVLPAQFTVLNRWPADKSIRWVLVQFRVAIAGNGTASFTLTTGGGGRPPEPRRRLKITDKPDHLLVDTGAMRLTVRRKSFALFDTVRLIDGDEEIPLIEPGACGKGFTITTTNGETFSTGNDAGGKLRLEDAGPLRATIVAEGRHQDSRGNGRFDYQVRMYVYAGSRAVRVQYVFTRSGGRWPDEATDLRRVHVSVRPRSEGRVTSRAFDPLRQYFGRPGAKTSLRVPPRADRTQRFREGPAVVSVADEVGNGVAATIRWFWQLRPKSLEVAPDGTLSLNIIDARGPNDEPVQFYPGMSKTHDLLFHFTGLGDSADDELATRHFQQPLFVKCDPGWYCQKTQAFGRLVSADYKGYRLALRQTRKIIDAGMAEQIRTIRALRREVLDKKRGIDSHHVIHFGDGFHHQEGPGHLGLQWDNCQFGFTHILAMQYARTGDDLYLDTLREAAAFEGDIAVCWHKDHRGAPRVPSSGYHIVGHPDLGGTHVSETWMVFQPTGMLETYYLTGDRRHWEAGTANLRSALRPDGTFRHRDIHAAGALFRAAVHGYLATGDKAFLRAGRRLALEAVREFKRTRRLGWPNGGYSYSVGASLLEGLCVYHEFTGDPDLGTVLPNIVKRHHRQGNWTTAPRFAYMHYYAAELAGDKAYRKAMDDGMAGKQTFTLYERSHAMKDFSQRRRSVPLLMWYFTDLPQKSAPWAGKIDIGDKN